MTARRSERERPDFEVGLLLQALLQVGGLKPGRGGRSAVTVSLQSSSWGIVVTQGVQGFGIGTPDGPVAFRDPLYLNPAEVGPRA